MKDFVKTYWKQIGSVLILTAAYVLAHIPALAMLHDYFVGLCWALGVFNAGYVPSFSQTKGQQP